MAIERRALQRIAVGHAVLLPLLAEFFEGQFAIGPERIDDPDVLAEYLSWFHDCKSTTFSKNNNESTPIFLLRGAVPNCDFNTSNKTEINCEKN